MAGPDRTTNPDVFKPWQFALIAAVLFAIVCFVTYSIVKMPAMPQIHVVRQCRGGLSWLSQRGEDFYFEDNSNRLLVLPQDIEGACPRW